MKVLSLLVVLLLLTGCEQSDQTYKLVSVSEVAKQTLGQSKETSDWLYGFDTLREYKVGAFNCYVPDSEDESLFFCTNGKQLLFHHSGDSISIPLTEKTFLMLKDNNKNGEYDLLNYDLSDKSGKMLGIVSDLNLDGNADWRVIFNRGIEIFINGKWQVVKSSEAMENGQRKFNMIVGGISKDIVWNGKEYTIAE